jgi:hypothetical protein
MTWLDAHQPAPSISVHDHIVCSYYYVAVRILLPAYTQLSHLHMAFVLVTVRTLCAVLPLSASGLAEVPFPLITSPL